MTTNTVNALVVLGPLCVEDLQRWMFECRLSQAAAARKLGTTRAAVRHWVHQDPERVLPFDLEQALVREW